MDYLMTPNPLLARLAGIPCAPYALPSFSPQFTQKTLLVNPHPLLNKINLIFKS